MMRAKRSAIPICISRKKQEKRMFKSLHRWPPGLTPQLSPCHHARHGYPIRQLQREIAPALHMYCRVAGFEKAFCYADSPPSIIADGIGS
jgi:hypothetical protein